MMMGLRASAFGLERDPWIIGVMSDIVERWKKGRE
jgi:hypothetical protein